MSRKIATVVGATGFQGAAVISVLLQKPEYQVRAVTRSPDSKAAEALRAKGIEVVKADIEDEASLKIAFDGSHLIYGVTDFVPGFVAYGGQKAKEIETNLGRNIVRAAQATQTLEHFIWSTLPNVTDATNGKFSPINYDGKGDVNKLIVSDPALLAKTTFLMIGWYDTNFKYPIFTPTWIETAGKYVVIGDYPADAAILSIGSIQHNLPPFAKAIIEQPERTKNGAIVMGFAQKIGFEELLQLWASVHGKEAAYVKTDNQTVSKMWPKWTDLAEMTRFMGAYKGDYWFYKEDEILTAKKLGIADNEFLPLAESLKTVKV